MPTTLCILFPTLCTHRQSEKILKETSSIEDSQNSNPNIKYELMTTMNDININKHCEFDKNSHVFANGFNCFSSANALDD